MVSYLQSLVLLSARQALGHSLTERTPPAEPFSSTSRSARGSGAGDRVDSMIEGRVTLEKIKVLEGKMKYQIDKLVRVAEESADSANNAVNGTFATRFVMSRYSHETARSSCFQAEPRRLDEPGDVLGRRRR